MILLSTYYQYHYNQFLIYWIWPLLTASLVIKFIIGRYKNFKV
jgi:hypothetical protein